VRVLFVGGESAFLDNLKSAIAGSDLVLAGVVPSLSLAAEELPEQRPHVILVSVDAFGEESAPVLLDAVSRQQVRPGIVVVAPAEGPAAIRAILRLEAREFLSENASGDQILKLVESLGVSVRTAAAAENGLTLAVWGCRGGVGGTTLALTLAGICRKRNLRVAVVDGDMTLGDSAFLLNVKPPVGWADWSKDYQAGERDVTRYLVHAAEDFAVLAAPKAPAQAELVRPEPAAEAIRKLQKGHDLVIVDLPRNFDDLTMTLVESVQHLWLVSDVTLAGVKNLALIWALLEQLRLPHDERSTILSRVERDGMATAERIRESYRIIGCLPPEGTLSRSWERGLTPASSMPKSAFTKAVELLADRITARKAGGRE
jgi:pilus assembly protein CpaE